ncbi:MAG TPA: hypothetical protein VLM38_14750 [Blastocatellia bacterium]|nr:hypothetical protein [Blastocatellia bacterium]
MSLKGSDRARINNAMLMICDTGGKVQAVASMAARDEFPEFSLGERDIAQIPGFGAAINGWLDERIREARGHDEYSAETWLENGDARLFVKLESLRRDDELYGFAVQISPSSTSEALSALRDGDSIVERAQWHEIKNHVGALKLYATFLKRKMAEGDERRTVEKIVNGVNALIGYLDRVRRGEAQ